MRTAFFVLMSAAMCGCGAESETPRTIIGGTVESSLEEAPPEVEAVVIWGGYIQDDVVIADAHVARVSVQGAFPQSFSLEVTAPPGVHAADGANIALIGAVPPGYDGPLSGAIGFSEHVLAYSERGGTSQDFFGALPEGFSLYAADDVLSSDDSGWLADPLSADTPLSIALGAPPFWEQP